MSSKSSSGALAFRTPDRPMRETLNPREDVGENRAKHRGPVGVPLDPEAASRTRPATEKTRSDAELYPRFERASPHSLAPQTERERV